MTKLKRIKWPQSLVHPLPCAELILRIIMLTMQLCFVRAKTNVYSLDFSMNLYSFFLLDFCCACLLLLCFTLKA